MMTLQISAIKSAVSRLPIRVVILLPLLTLMACVAASGTWVVSRHEVAAERNINAQRAESESRRYLNAINHVLEYADTIININMTAFRSGLVASADDRALRSLFQDQVLLLGEVDYIGFGRPNGDYIAVDRITEDGSLRVVSCKGVAGRGRLIIEPLPGADPGTVAGGASAATRVRREDKGEYVVTTRPWYQAAVEERQGTPVWSPVFVYATDPILAINRSLAIRDGSGNVLGVLTVSLNMKRLGEMLKGIQYIPGERVFVIEEHSGLLVATSTISSLFYVTNNIPSRISATECDDAVIRSAAGELPRAPAGAGPIFFSHEGRPLVLSRISLGGADAPPWLLASATPLDSAVGDLAVAKRQYRLYAILALGIAAVLGVLAAELIARPIRSMVRAAQALDEGIWDMPLPVDRGDALGELARAFGEMRFRLRQKLASHLEKMPLGVIEWDRDFRVTSWSDSATKIFGYPSDYVIGKTPKEIPILDPETWDKVVAPLWSRLVSKSGGGQSENDNLAKGGRRIRCDWYNSTILDHKGKVTGVISLVQDVTRKRQTEEELRRATKEKEEFLAVMSHELRTPLTSVVGFAQLLERNSVLDEAQGGYVASILSSCDQVLSIVDRILELRRNESGLVRLAEVDFDPSALLQAIYDAVKPKAVQKDLDFECKSAPDLPVALRGDPTRLRQVLDNLLSNALKFTKRGRIEMRVRVINDWGPLVEVEFAVEDTGIGIAPDELPRLFKPFYRIDSSLGREYPGTGLGLAIAQGIAQLMGTSIAVESEPGRGTTFSFKARFEKGRVERIAHGSPPPSEVRPARARPPIGPSGSPSPRILCVEDEPSTQRLVKSVLGRFGWDATVVGDGEQALKCVFKAPFDVILMDCHLPGKDGFKLADEIRHYERRGKLEGRDADCPIPIIGFSADIIHSNKLSLFNTFIEKPFEIDTLINVICSVLGCPLPEVSRETRAVRPAPGGDAIDLARFVQEFRGLPGGEAIARDAIREFAKAGYDFYMQPLESAMDSGDRGGIHDAAHQIKGAAKNIWAEPLRAAVEAVRLASEKDLEAARRSMDSLRAEMRRSLEAAEIITSAETSRT